MTQPLLTTKQEALSPDEDQISLIDIALFMRRSYKTIATSALLGLVLAIAYIGLTPKRYEASAQITMAQMSPPITATNNNNLTPLGVNIEEPALLISRLAAPTSFTDQQITACGLAGQANASQALAKAIKLTPVKAVANVVELQASGASPQQATNCVASIFELIKSTQAQIVAPYIQEAQIKLADDQKRLASAQQVILNADKSAQAMSASYLSTRDEVRYLLDETTALRNVITSSQSRATRLVAPIYASDAPASPKTPIALFVGLVGGLLLGVIIALARQLGKDLQEQWQAAKIGQESQA